VSQIENLPHREIVIVIAQKYLIGQAALSQRIGKGGTNGSGADNHDLSWFPWGINHQSSSVADVLR
jgi:hypothetical protein